MTEGFEKELKAKFDGKDIFTLEKMVEDRRQASRRSMEEMIEVLHYLKTSNRFKENKLYAHESFFNYIEDRFSISPPMYYEQEKAYLKFPEETVQHGVGFVAKTIRLCGARRAKEVFQEISKAEAKGPLTREKKKKIMEERRDPKREKMPKKDWKSLYEREVQAHDRTKEALKEAMATIKERDERIEKLMKTASVIVGVRKALAEGAEVRPQA
jgi:hypothetical protein